MKRQAGFTLIEIMLVVMIIAVMTGISMPLMKGTFQSARIKAASREVAGFLRLARNTAVLRERPCEIRFNLEKDQYWLVLLDENANEEDLNKRQERRERQELKIGEDAASVHELPKDVHFAVIYSGASVTEDKKLPRVIYYADGSSTPATIVVQDKKKRAFNIEVYQTTGMARVEEGMPVQLPDKSKLYYGPKAEDRGEQ
jgi:type II secretion system protein H